MFGISLPELAVIFVIILIVFGPEKLPEIALKLGKLTGELKRNSEAVRREFYNAVYKPAEDFRRKIDSVAKDTVRELNPLAAPEPPLTPAAEPGLQEPNTCCCDGSGDGSSGGACGPASEPAKLQPDSQLPDQQAPWSSATQSNKDLT